MLVRSEIQPRGLWTPKPFLMNSSPLSLTRVVRRHSNCEAYGDGEALAILYVFVRLVYEPKT